MAHENYYACVAFVRRQEGGNTDTPGDRGGRTGRGGITHTTYDVYRDRKGLPRQDVFKISDAEIAEIYAREYWDPIHGDELAAGVDLCIFDYAINSGPKKANWERLQAIAGGAKEAAALIRKICADRLAFMHALGSWSRFGKGWGRRVAECEATALQMVRVPLRPVLEDAKAKREAAKTRASAVVAAGAPASAGTHEYLHHGLWVLAALIGIVALLAAIAAFNAWRQGQRADALTAAVKKMQAEQAAAFAAKMATDAAANLKAKAIAADQAALAVAKDAIGKVEISQPAK